MKTAVMTGLAAGLAAVLFAGPAAKLDPVANGYPDWQGVVAKNYIAGREIAPSDLRHKVTVVLEVEPNEKLKDQFLEAYPLSQVCALRMPDEGADNWEIPRDVFLVISCRGFTDRKALMELLKSPKGDDDAVAKLRSYGGYGDCVYDEVTFTGAPDSTGKRPYVYVMGPTGTEPLWHGQLNAAGIKEARSAIAKGQKEMRGWETKWRPYFGNIAEPKFHPQIAKALEKGKTAKAMPLEPVAKSILANVKSPDEEKAKEAQVLYDALIQARDDLVLKINLASGRSPHVAVADLQDLNKFWPAEKKRVEKAIARIKANPELDSLGKLFLKVRTWSDPEFMCKNVGEAKKIVAELTKAKKMLEKLKESKSIPVQNAALIIDMRLADLIDSMPNRVPQK